MAKKKKEGKEKLSFSLILVGLISTVLATFSLMCIPCIMGAYPAIPLFFAFLGALSLLLMRYSWLFLALGVLLIGVGVLLQLSGKKKKCDGVTHV